MIKLFRVHRYYSYPEDPAAAFDKEAKEETNAIFLVVVELTEGLGGHPQCHSAMSNIFVVFHPDEFAGFLSDLFKP